MARTGVQVRDRPNRIPTKLDSGLGRSNRKKIMFLVMWWRSLLRIIIIIKYSVYIAPYSQGALWRCTLFLELFKK